MSVSGVFEQFDLDCHRLKRDLQFYCYVKEKCCFHIIWLFLFSFLNERYSWFVFKQFPVLINHVLCV